MENFSLGGNWKAKKTFPWHTPTWSSQEDYRWKLSRWCRPNINQGSREQKANLPLRSATKVMATLPCKLAPPVQPSKTALLVCQDRYQYATGIAK
ncbi:hypothetical protein BHM03_00055523 [Ensete ventricosum]|nr:hypothetical protein BHM03_00055523 [Ensete ventricosum]